ncbi:TerC family protein [Planctomyces sp. SH-PL62]|uniref:TerC family protein n=1 Tax=Planctomyces sp. SH-PL62 TaxID=1636152 RepID=UPI00078C2769|nr:TerC family protein [Planctomyces sp. SH-PL62]AMV37459.1 Integral membrane protein TerC family protein [Planctomyces sp. SH-PL62]
MVDDFSQVIAILKIILFDLLLSGDNAVVIGMAAHRLPPAQRRQAMIWGCGLAIFMRIGLTLVVSTLLVIPGIRFIGAIFLVWIAAKLMQEEVDAASDHPHMAPASLFKAIQRIALADFIMSLDNVLAIASAAQSSAQIVMGLVLSIMMLLFLSAVITEIMNRYRWIVYAGAALLAWTAADMMAHDLHDFFHKGYVAGWPEFPAWGLWALRFTLVALCLTVNIWLPDSDDEDGGEWADAVEPPPTETSMEPSANP